MENTNFSMGDIIRSVRKSRGCTQDALAQAAGISVQAVSKWETGASLPDITLLPSIADFLNISIDTLFNRTPLYEQNVQTSSPIFDKSSDHTLQYTGSITADTASPQKDLLESMFSDLSCLFSNQTADASADDLLLDDDVLRVVQLRGRHFLSAAEVSQKPIALSVEHLGSAALNVEIYGSAQIHGSVGGNVKANGSVTCADIGGSATAGDDVTCANVGGSVTAGDKIDCHNIGGDAAAGDCITCGDIHGSVSADSIRYKNPDGQNDSVRIRISPAEQFNQQKLHIEQLKKALQEQSEQLRIQASRLKEQIIEEQRAKLTESMNRRTRELSDLSAYNNGALNILQVMNGRVLSAHEASARPICLALEDADGLTIHIHGNAEISGDICGDVHAKGNVRCDVVEGDIDAGSVSCGNVEGDVNAGGVTCGSVEGDVNAGSITCQNVSGDVRAEGCVTCNGSIEGDVSADGSITCGNIGGDVRTDSDISCGNVEGDVTACGSFHCEGDIEGDVYRR